LPYLRFCVNAQIASNTTFIFLQLEGTASIVAFSKSDGDKTAPVHDHPHDHDHEHEHSHDADKEVVEKEEKVELWNKDAPAGPEWKGPRNYEPTRYGDWSRSGRVSDF